MEILNTKLQGSFTPSKDSKDISVAPSGEIDATSNAILIDKNKTADTNVANAPELNEAIIIPQTLKEQTDFIRVTLDDENDTELTYKLGAETIFAQGQKYRYTITAKLTELIVESKIEDWKKDEGDNTGTAEL